MTISPPPAAETAAAVRPATASDAPWLSRAIAAAFYDDPVWGWMLPGDDAGRMTRYERFCRLLAFPMMLPHGVSSTTAGVAGGALWMPPGAAHTTVWEQVRALPAMARVGGRRTRRLLSCLTAMDRDHPACRTAGRRSG